MNFFLKFFLRTQNEEISSQKKYLPILMHVIDVKLLRTLETDTGRWLEVGGREGKKKERGERKSPTATFPPLNNLQTLDFQQIKITALCCAFCGTQSCRLHST